MPDSPVTLGEVNRSIVLLRQSVEGLRSELVSKDVWKQAEQNRNAQIEDIRGDLQALERRWERSEERRLADRRLVFAALVAPLLLLMLQLYLASKPGGVG